MPDQAIAHCGTPELDTHTSAVGAMAQVAVPTLKMGGRTFPDMAAGGDRLRATIASSLSVVMVNSAHLWPLELQEQCSCIPGGCLSRV